MTQQKTTSDFSLPIGIEDIRKFMPHRQPFLLLDRIMEIHTKGDLMDLSPKGKEGIRVVARKCVTYNEPHFAGHFPHFAIMPGVLVIEAMAQAASFSLYPYMKNYPTVFEKGLECLLVGVDNARLRKPVVPGDVLVIETTVVKTKARLWWFDCVATVDGQKVAEASLLANFVTDMYNLTPKAE